jgi:protein-arginine kinase activator protein McsA
MSFILKNLPQVNTKRILSYYKSVRAKLHNLICEICNEVHEEDEEKAAKIRDELKILKTELDKREHREK